MRTISRRRSTPEQRRWRLQLLSFALLGSSIWLYYDHKVQTLEQRQHQLIKPAADP